MTMETYCICLEASHDGKKAAVLTKKGGDSINSARHAKRLILVEAGQTVHLKCRRHLFRPQKKNAISRSRATCIAVQKKSITCYQPTFRYSGFRRLPRESKIRKNKFLVVCTWKKATRTYFGDRIVITTTKKQVFWITLKMLSYLITKVNCFRTFPGRHATHLSSFAHTRAFLPTSNHTRNF